MAGKARPLPAVIARSEATKQSRARRAAVGSSGRGLLRRFAPRNDSGRVGDSSQHENALAIEQRRLDRSLPCILPSPTRQIPPVNRFHPRPVRHPTMRRLRLAGRFGDDRLGFGQQRFLVVVRCARSRGRSPAAPAPPAATPATAPCARSVPSPAPASRRRASDRSARRPRRPASPAAGYGPAGACAARRRSGRCSPSPAAAIFSAPGWCRSIRPAITATLRNVRFSMELSAIHASRSSPSMSCVEQRGDVRRTVRRPDAQHVVGGDEPQRREARRAPCACVSSMPSVWCALRPSKQ